MRGLLTYLADAALLEDCVTGRRRPVAMEAGYAEAERAYLELRTEPGAPVLVVVVGRIEVRPTMEGDGLIETVVVDRLVEAFPDADCAN